MTGPSGAPFGPCPGATPEGSPLPEGGLGGGSHMGERWPDGADAGFRWNTKVLLESSRLVDMLPCAQTPLCAHGSASTLLDGRP